MGLPDRSVAQVSLAVVDTAPAPSQIGTQATGALVCQVRLQPGDVTAECRVAALGAGLGAGVGVPISPGDEVVVVFPDKGTSRGVIVGSLHNATRPNPASNDGLQLLLQSPLGVHLRSADGLPARRLVLADLLFGLNQFAVATNTLIGALAMAPDILAVNAAAGAWLANGQVVAFLTNLATSAGSDPLDPGAPPYASDLHRATT
jgi:hypothetical protein